jgi:glutaredoxin 3
MNFPSNEGSRLPAEVVMYRTPFCGYCIGAARFLERKGVRVQEIDVSGKGDCRRWLFEATGMRTVPQIFINGRSVRGFEDIVALDRQGGLDPLLREAPGAVSAVPMPCQGSV